MMNKILVLGLGAGDLNQIPYGVYKSLTKEKTVYLRTKEHPVVSQLEAEGFHFSSFDSIYEQNDEFSAVYEKICETLLEKASTETKIIYAVPGHPLVAEKTVQLLLERAPKYKVEIEIGGGQSFLDAAFQALKIDPIEGFQLLDATDLSREMVRLNTHMLIGQVYDRFVASEVKLTLMEKFPDEYKIAIVTAAGSERESIKWIPLYELDREVEVDNLTTVYVPPANEDSILYREFSTLRQIIATLRGPNGCPWDKKQTHASLKKYLIEESYELIEAINEEDIDHIIEELGDVLLQVMLHAQIGEDDAYFTIDDVIAGISEKMVRRHPHVFGTFVAEDEEAVLKNWQIIKQQEKGEEKQSLLEGVGKGLPNLLKAVELQKEAAKVGFDWGDITPILEKVQEEFAEFQEAMQEKSREEMELEFGDLLFALVNVARHEKINPEEALLRTNQKFSRRFRYIEEKVAEAGRPFTDFTLEELDAFWVEAKEKGK
ncbi:nucleoside triphosphate pyrophosphohydrolase [Bacillus sp. B15-48]|uniref:nucleoside triphosphate pyrophosphohydrolase n=1 Tax=Bacillus sp. B15-48 TaxID=1548601 RepID=UPI00193FD859|nr:nucleoside triphosphate pyrophosphohydrolase [Bacillus sp. B15-48]MBM4765306.1 nucleoside triphosphate pyrophosphohydrolase [Bacillus sp. B15-48]